MRWRALLLALPLVLLVGAAADRWPASSGSPSFDVGFQPMPGLALGNNDTRCLAARIEASTFTTLGLSAASTGTISCVIPSGLSTLLATQTRCQVQSAPGAGSSASSNANVGHLFLGSSPSFGGFSFWTRWYIFSGVGTQRVLVGVKANGSAIGNAQPSATLDAIYIGCDALDANLSVCSNDGAGAATCSTLGASFPCKTALAFYDMRLDVPRQATTVNWQINRLDVAASAAGTITSDLPTNTVVLGPLVHINNESTATAVEIGITGMCTRE